MEIDVDSDNDLSNEEKNI